MSFPEFFAAVPSITLHDGLSELLGATTDGCVEYHYEDAVKLAGHSCPTVAGAWLMACAAIKALYPDGVGERGGMTVEMGAPEAEGVTGVIAQVLTLLTGAAAANGFHGIAGQHVRQGLLCYGLGTEDAATVTVTRSDTGASVALDVDLSSVAPHPDLPALANLVLRGTANPEQRNAFGLAWQDRVQRLLLEHAADPRVVRVKKLT